MFFFLAHCSLQKKKALKMTKKIKNSSEMFFYRSLQPTGKKALKKDKKNSK
jgi:hypothetical protein